MTDAVKVPTPIKWPPGPKPKPKPEERPKPKPPGRPPA